MDTVEETQPSSESESLESLRAELATSRALAEQRSKQYATAQRTIERERVQRRSTASDMSTVLAKAISTSEMLDEPQRKAVTDAISQSELSAVQNRVHEAVKDRMNTMIEAFGIDPTDPAFDTADEAFGRGDYVSAEKLAVAALAGKVKPSTDEEAAKAAAEKLLKERGVGRVDTGADAVPPPGTMTMDTFVKLPMSERLKHMDAVDDLIKRMPKGAGLPNMTSKRVSI